MLAKSKPQLIISAAAALFSGTGAGAQTHKLLLPFESNTHINISKATPNVGVTGFVENQTSHARIYFNSSHNPLITKIETTERTVLFEYSEERLVPIGDSGSVEPDPVLSVSGLNFLAGDSRNAVVAKDLALSSEGDLVRYLALYIIALLPDPVYQPERRGLELAYQAVQDGFPDLGTATKSDLSVDFRKYKSLFPSLFSEWPKDCRLKDCESISTSDYLISRGGGFVVKTSPIRLVLNHNFAERGPVRNPKSTESNKVVRDLDNVPRTSQDPGKGTSARPDIESNANPDPNQVDNCFGRCGGGCGNWRFAQTGNYTPITNPTPYCSKPQFFCSPPAACNSDLIDVTFYVYPGVWTATGKVTSACELHDACVRGSPLNIFDPFCEAAFGPQALADLLAGAGTDTTWTYQGQSESFAGVQVTEGNSYDCNQASPSYPWWPNN